MIRSLVATFGALAVLGLAAAPLRAPSAQAGGHAHGHHPAAGVTVERAWARPSPSQNGAVYMVVRNAGGEADRIVAASSDRADGAELHAHEIDAAGVARMRRVEAVPVPAGGEVAFAPGGLHVMLLGLRAPLRAGDAFPLRLTLEGAGVVTVDVAVTPRAPAGGHGHAGH